MRLNAIDWLVLALYGVVSIAIGLMVVRRASEGRHEFFLSGRRLSWWLLGVSLVATTFSTDTPNLVTDLVRSGGVSQNWVWWAFAVTGMCTVFFYAKLWRRSAALTDIAFYESRPARRTKTRRSQPDPAAPHDVAPSHGDAPPIAPPHRRLAPLLRWLNL